VVNAGTTGLPDDGDTRPIHAELTLGEELGTRIHGVRYDVDRVVEAVREQGNPGRGRRCSARGR